MATDIEPETGTCDLNPSMATMGEWARDLCNECRQPLSRHLTPDEWAAIDATPEEDA